MALSTIMASLSVVAMIFSLTSMGLVTIRFHDSGVARHFWQRARGSLSVWSARRRRGPFEGPHVGSEEESADAYAQQVSLLPSVPFAGRSDAFLNHDVTVDALDPVCRR